ncbi:MAG: hypothetical protein IJW48_04840, partial [Clostridia bacterium]|nr:hypothetical protein [Clostridia bacterium]
MSLKELKKISDEQVKSGRVSSLSNTPNRTTIYGKGISATELKGCFDKLPELLVKRFNDLLAALQSKNFSQEIPVILSDNVTNLAELVASIKNGELLKLIKDSDGNELSAILEKINVVRKGTGVHSVQQSDTNAKSIGDRSVAFNSAIAGCLGYRYKAIDLANHKIYLTENEITYDENNLANILFTTEGFSNDVITSLIENITLPYSVGDIFTLKTRSTDYDNMGTITAIEKNVITFASGTELDHLSERIVKQNDVYIDRYSFSVPKKCELGHIIVSEDVTAFGTDGTRIAGRFGFGAGRNLLGIGDLCILFGRDNVAGYGCFVAGQNSKGLGDRNYTLAHSGTNWGAQAFLTGSNGVIFITAPFSTVGGFGNKSYHRGGTLFGTQNYPTENEDECIVGRASQSEPLALFVVGNGVIDEDTLEVVLRSNAFVVYEDGRAKVGARPINPFDIVPKCYVDDLIIPLEKGTGNNSVQQTGSDASGRHSIALLGGTASKPNTLSIGEDAVSDAQYGISLGRGAGAHSDYSISVGLQLQSASPEYDEEGNLVSANREQTLFGRYNEILPGAKRSGDTSGAVYIVGVGTQAKRKNGLVVWGDGRVSLGNEPVDDLDAVNLAFLKNYTSKIYRYRGSVSKYTDLPTANLSVGDVYNVVEEYTNEENGVVYPAGTNFAWGGSMWDPLGGDFGEYLQRLANAESGINLLSMQIGGLDSEVEGTKTDIAVLEEKEEWDYVITKPEDFTTENLATMSGRVLVKGGTIDIADDTLSIPSTV